MNKPKSKVDKEIYLLFIIFLIVNDFLIITISNSSSGQTEATGILIQLIIIIVVVTVYFFFVFPLEKEIAFDSGYNYALKQVAEQVKTAQKAKG